MNHHHRIMNRRIERQSFLFLKMWILFWFSAVSCLHFYLKGNTQKCFVEELSKETHIQGFSSL
jgi:hypothetical protein